MYAAWDDTEHAQTIIRMLLDKGADVNPQCKFGANALTVATANIGNNNEEKVRLLVSYGATLPSNGEMPPETESVLKEYINGAQNWTPLHRAADARDFGALSEYLRMGTVHPKEEVVSSHPDMCTALKIASSNSYPTAQPVCKRCLELLQLPDPLVTPRSSGGGDEETEAAGNLFKV